MRESSISARLQWAFAFSALLTLFVGGVGFYAWYQQRAQITFGVTDYFPKVNAALQVEENLNLLMNEYNALIQASAVAEQQQARKRLDSRLSHLRSLAATLDNRIGDIILKQVRVAEQLLPQLDDSLNQRFQLVERLRIISVHINWLHDDLNSELKALLQEVGMQQSALLEALVKEDDRDKRPALQDALRASQDEQRRVYNIISLENQIVNDLQEQILSGNQTNQRDHYNYLSYLKGLLDENMSVLTLHSSSISVRQIMDELLGYGLLPDRLPFLLIERDRQQQKLEQQIADKDRMLQLFRQQVESQIGGSQQQLQMLHQVIEKSTRISGLLIVLAMLTALLLFLGVNFFYIRPRLLGRFIRLNEAVTRLSQGEAGVAIPVGGSDELGRIARLLQRFSAEVEKKSAELQERNVLLQQEVLERVQAEQELRTMQNELIQAAKLAVVGQTLTTLGHEINQPLNALGTYLFSLNRALERDDRDAARLYLEKMRRLIERTAAIVRRLRQFGRRSTGTDVLQPVEIMNCVREAWGLLESVHRPRRAELRLSEGEVWVLGEEVLLQQVWVNLFTNALEAMAEGEPPRLQLQVDMQQHDEVSLYLSDNGCGWPLQLADHLLQPFTSSKSVNLGIGLSISCSIMMQCSGALSIASTLDRHALVILVLRKQPLC
ncbi:ATP-binding protein [Edaphovirga cremea]|uniref:ATP-binding protein n=1 Tax=Edaphovirga cremea TaxID=2267246 RepID=UPI0039896C6E